MLWVFYIPNLCTDVDTIITICLSLLPSVIPYIVDMKSPEEDL